MERGSSLTGRQPPSGVEGPSPSQSSLVLLSWAWRLSQGSLFPECWGGAWKNILGLCRDENHSTLSKFFSFQALDHFEPQPQWAWKVGVSPGEMVFGNIFPLSPQMAGYGKAQDLRNSTMIDTKDSDFRPTSSSSSNTYEVHDLGRSS